MVISGIHGLGAAAKSAAVRALQMSLRALSSKVNDSSLLITADGIVGPETRAATNKALRVYASDAPPLYKAGSLTTSQIAAQAGRIKPYIDHAGPQHAWNALAPLSPTRTAANPAAASAAAGQAAGQAAYRAASMIPTSPASQPAAPGGSMPAYQPGYPSTAPYAAQYYPPGSAPGMGPGGLPTDRASVDVRAFIPAQYEQLRVHPLIAIGLVLGVGYAVITLVRRHDAKRAG